MALTDVLFGRKPQNKKRSLQTKEQQAGTSRLINQGIETQPAYQSGLKYLTDLVSGSPQATQAFQQPYMDQFNQQIAPGIAERFGAASGTGAGGASSSALNQALSQAGITLQNQLAALRSGMQMQAAQNILPYSQQPYSNLQNAVGLRTFENLQQEGSPGLIQQGLEGIGGAFSAPLGQLGARWAGDKLFGNPSDLNYGLQSGFQGIRGY